MSIYEYAWILVLDYTVGSKFVDTGTKVKLGDQLVGQWQCFLELLLMYMIE